MACWSLILALVQRTSAVFPLVASMPNVATMAAMAAMAAVTTVATVTKQMHGDHAPNEQHPNPVLREPFHKLCLNAEEKF